LIPEGELVTVPLPLPSLLTVSSHSLIKVAVTDLAAVMFTVHWLPEEESQPLHEPNRDPEAAEAVSVTVVP
jgi:hypothetical protein